MHIIIMYIIMCMIYNKHVYYSNANIIIKLYMYKLLIDQYADPLIEFSDTMSSPRGCNLPGVS